MDRTPRTETGRESEARRKPWSPPSYLSAPQAPAGYVYRWIRTGIRGEEDKMNLSMRFREGWEPVKASDHPEFVGAVIDEGRYDGVIGSGGLILCKAPVEMVNERRRYYEGETTAQADAVEERLSKHRAEAAAENFQITVNKSTKVTTGRT